MNMRAYRLRWDCRKIPVPRLVGKNLSQEYWELSEKSKIDGSINLYQISGYGYKRADQYSLKFLTNLWDEEKSFVSSILEAFVTMLKAVSTVCYDKKSP